MNSIWRFINAPVVVVMLGLSLWPILTVMSSGVAVKMGLKDISEAVSEEIVRPFENMGAEQDRKVKAEASVLAKVVVSDVGFAPTSWAGKVKVIGTITNKADAAVKGIHVVASLYQDGKLVNVNDEWLARLKVLQPGASADFNFTLDVTDEQSAENLDVTVKVADLALLD